MLGGGNSGGGIANDTSQVSKTMRKFLKYQMIWMTKFHSNNYAKLIFQKIRNIKLISMHDEMSSSYLVLCDECYSQ